MLNLDFLRMETQSLLRHLAYDIWTAKKTNLGPNDHVNVC